MAEDDGSEHEGGGADERFVEHTLDSRNAFVGKLLHVSVDRVRVPDGTESLREYVRHPGAVMIIAELPDGRLVLERQYRYPLRRVFLELPAGKIDRDEDVLACARRELQEETGYVAADWRHLGTMHPCIGYSDERIEIFLARGLTMVGAALDDGEYLEIVELSLAQACEAVFDGRITDAKTITGLFWAQRLLG